jgi:hypothetical protein
MATKLLEKDIHEKQDTIVSLRRQLEDIKQINLEMYRKLQVIESFLGFNDFQDFRLLPGLISLENSLPFSPKNNLSNHRSVRLS